MIRKLQTTTAGTHRVLVDDGHFLWGEKYWERESQGAIQSDNNCIACGRATSRQGKGYGVLVSGGGAVIVHPDDYVTYPHDGGEMGWFPIGSECIKQIPKEFRVGRQNDE